MTYDLNLIKANLNILNYVIRTNPQCSEKRVGNIITINPCPLCGHKEDFRIYPDTNTFSCFRDHVGGSIIDLIMLIDNCACGTAIKKCAKILDLDNGVKSSNNHSNFEKPVLNNYDYKKFDFTDLINIAHENCPQTNYYKNRGLSEKIIEKYMLGYHKDGFNFAVEKSVHDVGKSNYLLKFYKYYLPVLDEDNICRYFITRLEDKSVPERLKNNFTDKTHNPRGLKVQLFNQRYISKPTLANNIIFVVEGIFDALSLEEFGLSAIALNSTSNTNLLLKLIKANKDQLLDKSFVIIGDNDTAGVKMSETLLKQLSDININVLNCVLPVEYKDCNEFLVKDKSAFEKFFDSLVNGITTDPEAA